MNLVFPLQEGGPLPGPRRGLLCNTCKWIVWGDTHADKARDFIGKGLLGGKQKGKGTQKDCSATWLTLSGFMVMGLVSRLSLANHSDSGSFLVVYVLLSQDGRQQGGFWEVRHVASPFGLSSWWWLVSSELLTRTSCYKIIHTNAHYGTWPGWMVSVSGFPRTFLWQNKSHGNLQSGMFL